MDFGLGRRDEKRPIDPVISKAERDVAIGSVQLEMLGSSVAIAAGVGLMWLFGVDHSKLWVLALAGLVGLAHSGWKWYRLRFATAPVKEVMKPLLLGPRIERWYALREGEAAELCVVYHRTGIRGPWEMVRVLYQGKEVETLLSLEGVESVLLPDRTVLTLRLVPDFWRHRRLVVEHEGRILTPRPSRGLVR